ncbi:Formyl-coenzyme A transferase [Anoxybacillus thermarum]|uniref:Formyl-coenzyme A transferase n=1 Tax=Anoxybacillus thermarum TaxID=404937 RepID=A0A0D0S0P7_9BACL|nr:CaiB/BaiF CoA-transferase family protein [Anoxybacillus thermarum]KIQ94461.1 Formyl-coenzyme A transferase [Anoxybacillus thermarum]
MLDGIKVIDFSHYLPGPFASLRLADLGAEVVKIEPKTGDMMRKLTDDCIFEANNKNKRSIAVDLKNVQDADAVRQLISQADVVIESFRPGVMRRLRLSYEDVYALNPSIVYCSISGYGQHSRYASFGSHDLNYMALTGMLAQFKDESGRPVHPTITLADFIGSIHAVEQIVSALYARERMGKGRYIDLSLVDGLLSMMTNHIVLEHHTGQKNGIPILAGTVVSYHLYETKDGRYMALAALEAHFWRNFCAAVGKFEWYEGHLSAACDDNSLFLDMKQLFRMKTFQQWIAFSEQVDCCLTPVLETDEVKTQFANNAYRKMIHINNDQMEVATRYDEHFLRSAHVRQKSMNTNIFY